MMEMTFKMHLKIVILFHLVTIRRILRLTTMLQKKEEKQSRMQTGAGKKTFMTLRGDLNPYKILMQTVNGYQVKYFKKMAKESSISGIKMILKKSGNILLINNLKTIIKCVLIKIIMCLSNILGLLTLRAILKRYHIGKTANIKNIRLGIKMVPLAEVFPERTAL